MQTIKTREKIVINIKEEKKVQVFACHMILLENMCDCMKKSAFGIGFDTGACQTLGRDCPNSQCSAAFPFS